MSKVKADNLYGNSKTQFFILDEIAILIEERTSCKKSFISVNVTVQGTALSGLKVGLG
ncbi:MAG: hypothetical protein HC905_06385 [Bacteroidales bacterium]|nr:hypothetical protein [Bacteroidales bacterium]